jgi:transcriptional regulator with XRE-family HTH domain
MSVSQTKWVTVETSREPWRKATALCLWGVVLAGTGGTASESQLMKHYGTGTTSWTGMQEVRNGVEQGVSAHLQAIRSALRLSVVELANLFGVTRPTIYSWQNGKPLSEERATRVRAMAHAIDLHLPRLEQQSGRIAHRAIQGNATVLQLLNNGAEPHVVIGRLADILQEESVQRERLARRLAERRTPRGVADVDSFG